MENSDQTNLMSVWERPNHSNLKSEEHLIFVVKPSSFHTEKEHWALVFGPASEEDCQKFISENTTSYDFDPDIEHLDWMEQERMQAEEDWYYDQMLDDLQNEAFEP